jgi:hypothetical protein
MAPEERSTMQIQQSRWRVAKMTAAFDQMLSQRGGPMKIIAARITAMPRPMPHSMFAPLPEVYVTMEDGTETMLFSYYPDELHFTPGEFLGLTEEEARRLKREKDVRYLRS